jgi:hypothetical protein
MNMPYDQLFSDTIQAVDKYSGYTTKYSSYYELGLAKGNHFFINSDTAQPIVAKVNTTIIMNMTDFINETYPRNGTAAWPTGEKAESYYLNRLDGTPETIVPICVAAVMCAITLSLVIVTCECFCRQRK